MIYWTIKDLVEVIQKRQQNKFDCNIVVSGSRGNGKSTFAFKTLLRLKGFDPWKHQVYCREDVISLMESQKYGIIFDDEAINSGYKRSFYSIDQQKLIRMINMYRDNFNVYVSAIPHFYALDKDIRNLMKIHINIIERGLAIVHIAKEGNLYSDDPWEVKYNAKIEAKWAKKRKKDPEYFPPYHKLSTFVGYIRFNDLKPKQRELYEEIKATKRKELYEAEKKIDEEKDPVKMLYKRVLKQLNQGMIWEMDEVKAIARANGIKVKTFISTLNQKLKEKRLPSLKQIIESKSGSQVSRGKKLLPSGDKQKVNHFSQPVKKSWIDDL